MRVGACQDCGAHAVTGKGRRLCDECRTPKPKLCITDCGTQVNFWGTRCRSCADDHNRTCMAAYMPEHRVHVKSYATIYSHLVKRARRRAGETGREFSLTVAFAKSAYPADGVMPGVQGGDDLEPRRAGCGGCLSELRPYRQRGWSNTHPVCFLCNSRDPDLSLAELADGAGGGDLQGWAAPTLGGETRAGGRGGSPRAALAWKAPKPSSPSGR